MKFIVDRASAYYGEKPCDNSKEEDIITYDCRGFKSFEEYEERLGESFLDFGFDHEVTDKGIVRKYKEKFWTIEFNSLEELNEFIDNQGSIIIYPKKNTKYKEITIYDDYVE